MHQFVIKTFSKLYENNDQRNFAARFQCGIPKIRDNVFLENENRKKFDALFIPVVHNLEEMLFAKDSCLKIIDVYKKKLEEKSEEFIKTSTIDEGISFDLNMFFKDFFVRGKIAIDNVIKLSDFLGFKINYFFAEDKKFNTEFEKITEKEHQVFKMLAERIQEERNGWLKSFQKMRNQIEHHGFQIPQPQYSLNKEKTKIQVHFFKLEKSFELEQSLQALWNNLLELLEDIIALFLATKIKAPFALQHLPEELRDKKLPLKYQVAILPNEIKPFSN